MNSLDADHANALDKSLAGDTLSGVVTVASTGEILLPNGGGSILVEGAEGIEVLVANGITAVAANGITPFVSGGISDGGVAGGIAATTAGGIAPTVASGITDGGVIGGIQPTVSKGIKSNVSHGIDLATAGAMQSSAVGGFVLAGGSSDWPTFSTARGRTVTRVPAPLAGLTGSWSYYLTYPGLLGPGNGGGTLLLKLDPLHDGATLQNVIVALIVTASHSGGGSISGMTMPSLSVYAYPFNTPSGALALSSTATQYAVNPGTGSAWYNGGALQEVVYTCNQNNVIASSANTYSISLTDESGTGSFSGNVFYSVELIYSVPNMAFP
jgi:hypothetical protein